MFEIAGAGYNYIHSEGWDIYRPQGFPHFNVVHIRNPFYYVEGGLGTNAVFVDHPAYLIYRPQDAEHFYLNEANYADDWIHFNSIGEDAEDFFREIDLPLARVIHFCGNSESSNMHQQIAAEYWKKGIHHEHIMDSMLRTYLYKLSDLYHLQCENQTDFATGTYESYRPRFDELRSRIYQGGEAARITSVDALAAEMNMSISYFQHLYKALYGVPVTKDLINARIEYAAYLLQNYNQTINNIATDCGYESIEHFNRQFRKIKGCSPSEFQTKT